MNRLRICAGLACILLLTGCGKVENPYRVDTVVRIPVEPTEATAATEVTETTETAAPTEATEPTEAAEPAKTSSSGKSTSGKTSSTGKKSSTGSKTESESPTEQGSVSIIIGTIKETEPDATAGAVTEPETQPPTEIPETVPVTEAPFDPSDYSPGSLDYAIVEELNARRSEAGLEELSMSGRLCGIAALRAREIADLWSHTRPDGRDYTSAMTDYGYGFAVSAENLVHVSGSGDAAAIVSKWMNTDNKNSILSESFTTAGVGVYRAGGVTYVVNLLVG